MTARTQPWDWLGLAGISWDWRGLAGIGWDWLGLAGIGWDWLGISTHLKLYLLTLSVPNSPSHKKHGIYIDLISLYALSVQPDLELKNFVHSKKLII